MPRLNSGLVSAALLGALLLGPSACDGSKAADPTQPESAPATVETEPATAEPATAEPATAEPAAEASQAQHPAAAYCHENGGKSEIAKSAKGGSVDVCVFEDGSRCRAWAFKRGECKAGDCQAADGKCGAE